MLMLYPSPTEFERTGRRGLPVLIRSGSYADERLMRLRDGTLRWFRVHGQTEDLADPFRLASWVFEPLPAGADVAKLSAREREVLAAMKQGLTAKQCALAARTEPAHRGEASSEAAATLRRAQRRRPDGSNYGYSRLISRPHATSSGRPRRDYPFAALHATHVGGARRAPAS